MTATIAAQCAGAEMTATIALNVTPGAQMLRLHKLYCGVNRNQRTSSTKKLVGHTSATRASSFGESLFEAVSKDSLLSSEPEIGDRNM